MSKKKLILSSSGLKNIVFTTYNNDDKSGNFRFIIGNKEFNTNSFFAEFISPRVSQLHQVDPTINSLDLTKHNKETPISIKNFSTSLINNIDKLSQGYSIEIDEEMSYQLRDLSILLGNEELFCTIEELFPLSNEETHIESSLLYLLYTETGNSSANFQTIIEFIASHFYLIEEKRLLQLPKKILYLILTNERLKLKNEDSLLDFINQIFENNEEDGKKHKNEFYEIIEFTSLSEDKLNDFLFSFDSSEMTRQLWTKLTNCFYSNNKIVKKMKTTEERMQLHNERYFASNDQKLIVVEYDDDPSHRFQGIITKLGQGNPQNAFNEKIIVASSSPCYRDSNRNIKHAFNFEDDTKIFHSKCEQNSWFCYDFKERKVKLSHYSLRSHGYENKKNNRLKTWCIEGSNNGYDWTILDSRTNEESVTNVSLSNTFKINEQSETNDFYRFIRICQTDVNNSNAYYLVFSAIEFFGTILES